MAYKKGDMLPKTNENVTYMVVGDRSKHDMYPLLKTQMMVHNIVRGTYYIEEQGYKGSAFYKITSAEMKRIEGFASKDTKVIKGVVLLQSLQVIR